MRVKLGDICKTNVSSYSSKDNYAFVNYLDTGNITRNVIDEIQYIDIRKDKLPSRARRKVKYNSILYSTVRPNQLHYGIIKEQPDNFLVSTGFTVIDVNDEIADADYIYYYLTQYEIVEHLHAIGEQSTSAYPSIKPSDLENLELELPDYETQVKIASVLKDLDDKIKLNNHINSNLEEQIQSVFANWLAENIEKAKEVSLGEVCEKVTDGSHYSPKDVPHSNIPMLSVKDMREYDFSFEGCKHISDDDYHKMIDNDCVPLVNDILVAKDGSYLKEIFICNEQRKIAILSSIAIFRPNRTIIYPEILLAFLKSPRVLQEVRDNYVSGSALPRIVLKDFKKLKFSLPNLTSQEKIITILKLIRDKIATNISENKMMMEIRDNLIHQFISKEIDLTDIDI